MTIGVRELVPGPRGIRLPREHGFWTMLAAAVFVAAARSQPSAALLLAATATVTMAVLSGAALATSIRRRGSLQVASAAALSLAGVPIELAGGSEPASTVLTSLALAVVFTSSALCVRASFARASRKSRSRSAWLQLAAGAISCLAAVLFVAVGTSAQVGVALLSLGACIALAIKKPGVKQMKSVGLFLATVTAAAALILVLF